MSGGTVSVALDRAIAGDSVPCSITVDHGTEFMSRALDDWPSRAVCSWISFEQGNPWKIPSSNHSTDGCVTSA